MDALARDPAAAPWRLAVLSTPRSGNTWLRRLLGTVYGLSTCSAHSPADVDWAALPARCALQLHWPPTPAFLELLERHQFRAVTLARHPLDTLLSILHFALLDASTARWLEGAGGDERSIYGAMPCSAAFRGYATGTRAAALLSVSRAWWSRPGVVCVRYEDLVRDPHGELVRLVGELGAASCRPVADAVAAHGMSRQRQDDPSHDYHYWRGEPGLWRRLLPAAQARPLAEALRDHLEEFGYACDPDPGLDVRQADAHWVQLVWEGLAGDLQKIKDTYATLARLRRELETTRTELQVSEQARREAQAQLDTTRTELARFEDLGPMAVATARRLRRLSLRYPRVAALLKKVVRSLQREQECQNGQSLPPHA